VTAPRVAGNQPPETSPPLTLDPGELRKPSPFDVCGVLPSGTTVLEASAGTGKTYALAALAARYVAEGVELDQIMMITFGRMATDELRLRVRERLTSVERCLAATRAPARDEVEQLLTDGPPDLLALRHARIARAVSEFDAATIATTHEFCSRMLDGLGVLGAAEPHAVFVEHLTELTAQVARDLYLQRYAEDGRAPMAFPAAERLARRVVEAGHTHLVPAAETTETDWEAAERAAFAAAVRAEVRHRQRRSRLVTYDDLLTRLHTALTAPNTGPAAAARLRERFSVVLVDEFQDTDPVQWDIIRRAFDGYATLVLIGDPKQAIYAFRGADVFSYLDARDHADRVATLTTNWRSDAPLTEALHALMGGAALGDPRIVVRDVASSHPGSRLALPGRAPPSGSPPGVAVAIPPVRLRVLPYDPEQRRFPRVENLRRQIQEDLVADITATLASGMRLCGDQQERQVEPRDIAVLVRANKRGEAVRDALLSAGVPAVMLGATSVYASAVAEEWLTLLLACEQPRQRQVRAAALTCFLGWTFPRLAGAGEDELTELTLRVRGWGRLLAGRGVAALLEAVSTSTRLPERLLATTGGERVLTDLRHLAQSLHAEMVGRRLGVPALVAWLREQMAEARADALTDSTRRLESDDAAVQILTLHRSKGLQFPIVYLPEAWDRHVPTRDEGQLLQLHDETGACILDVGGSTGAGRSDRLRQARAEEAGEELRLAYVGLTRARSQVVTWWAPAATTATSPLQRLLHRDPGRPDLPLRCEVTADPLGRNDLRAAGFSLERVEPRDPVATPRVGDTGAPLAARTFDRSLDLDWRRTSYSALTAAVHHADVALAAVSSEPEPTKEDDEVEAERTLAQAAAPAPAELARPSPMRLLPSGSGFGSAVHAVYEGVDPQADDLKGELARAARLALAQGLDAGVGVEALAEALYPSLVTPLGPLTDHRRLADIGVDDRLAELSFELPLAGGDRPGAAVQLGQVAPLLRRHLLPNDPLLTYPDLIDHPALAEQVLRGYLTGSIDAVLRVRDLAGEPRYLVVDYKTNWLGASPGGDGDPRLTLADYTRERMADAMMAAHYPLQALLYSVAVHRLLRWRQAGYTPERHLGGVLYLFLRGMAGPDTPTVGSSPCGVFSWRPPAALVTELSDLLDGAAP